MKTCPDCHLELPLADFNKDSSRRGGLQAYCRRCQGERLAKYYANLSPLRRSLGNTRNTIARRKSQLEAM